MLQLQFLGKDVLKIKKYIEQSPIKFCDISLGVKYMWRDDFLISYAIVFDTLIMCESCADYENAFYYPIGKEVDKALSLIEEYCLKKDIPLRFCCIDEFTLDLLKKRYPITEDYALREWSDYIYEADAFVTFSGKKYSGQRNHINKFKKTYPDYKFKIFTKDDLQSAKQFLGEYERESSLQLWTAKEEEEKCYSLIENFEELGQIGGFIEVGEKMVALSFGEVVGDTLIIHIEKGLKEYEGVYQVMVNEFAKAFVTDKIKYINREEDCGDEGLKISKMQYHPLEVKAKNIVVVKTLFDLLPKNIIITTERLTITPITEEDKDDYFRLYTDDKLNELWGYDYREDLGDNLPDKEFFYAFQNKLKAKKEEYSFAVRLNGKMIGELVLHNFDFVGGVEMGFRFFSEFQKKGYAFESGTALKNYVFKTLKPRVFKSRCFKQNQNSHRLIDKLGLSFTGEDEKCFYFGLNCFEKGK